MKTVNDLIRELSSIKEVLREKEINIVAENGMVMTPHLKIVLNDDKDPLNASPENIKQFVLTWDR